MKFRSILAAAAAGSLALAPAVSSASAERIAAPASEASEVGGDGAFLGLIAAGVLAAFIALSIDGDDDPTSP